MSKYYREEDLQRALIGFVCETGIDEKPYDYAVNVLDNLPTIEVKEDAISRADLIESFLADCECESREEARAATLNLEDMLELIDDAPSVIPKAKEERNEI